MRLDRRQRIADADGAALCFFRADAMLASLFFLDLLLSVKRPYLLLLGGVFVLFECSFL